MNFLGPGNRSMARRWHKTKMDVLLCCIVLQASEYAQQVVVGAGIPRLRDPSPALVGYAAISLHLHMTQRLVALLCCTVLQAFEYAQQVVAGAGIPRLRDFHPALVGYALAGNADKAGEVIRCMMEHCKPGDLTGVVVTRLGCTGGGGRLPGSTLGHIGFLPRMHVADGPCTDLHCTAFPVSQRPSLPCGWRPLQLVVPTSSCGRRCS